MNQASAKVKAVIFSSTIKLAVFTFFVNILLLIQPIYMLQIYDRVLLSASIETLLYISIIAAAALLLMGILDSIRNLLASRMAAKLEVAIGADALVASINSPRASIGDIQPLRDLGVCRNFISGRAIFAYLDLPFAPLFIGILYFIHPKLFWMTVAGAALLLLVAACNEWLTRRASTEASEHGFAATMAAQSFVRNGDSLKAMGMVGNVIGAWGREEAASLAALDRMNRTNALLSGLSRTLRLGLQLAVLGYGGYLVLAEQLTAGMIFASALISGRGLQPIDQVIGGWRSLTEARRSWKRLSKALERVPSHEAMELPDPVGRLDLEQIVVFPPNDPFGTPLLKGVSVKMEQGTSTVVLGSSGAGKTTLLRSIIGAIEPRSGTVRIDGADIRSYSGDRLGQYVGYLSQEVDLFPGTIAENIARFNVDAEPAKIVAAACSAQVHDLILKLPKGYDTRIGPGGLQLSGGQRQRIGLARAMFGQPRILLLDEPNANLDMEGEAALERALESAKASGTTVIVVSQRRPIADKADMVLIMRDGAVEDFGPREEVIARQAKKVRAIQEALSQKQPPTPQPFVASPFPKVVYGTAKPQR